MPEKPLFCLGEAWVELSADTVPELAETFQRFGRRVGRCVLPRLCPRGRARRAPLPTGGRPLRPQGGSPACRRRHRLHPPLLHGRSPYAGGLLRRGEASPLPRPFRRAAVCAGTVGCRRLAGRVRPLLFLRLSAGLPRPVDPPQGHCRRAGRRSLRLLCAPDGRSRSLLAGRRRPAGNGPAIFSTSRRAVVERFRPRSSVRFPRAAHGAVFPLLRSCRTDFLFQFGQCFSFYTECTAASGNFRPHRGPVPPRSCPPEHMAR